ncbi:hypothetical protein Q5752_003225 [Cryptotrichosporon argae]
MSGEWSGESFMLHQPTYQPFTFDPHPPSSTQTAYEPLPQTPHSHFSSYAAMPPPSSSFQTQQSPLHPSMLYGHGSTSSSSSAASSQHHAVPRRTGTGLTMTQAYVHPQQVSAAMSVHASPITPTSSSLGGGAYPNTHPPAHSTVPLPLADYTYALHHAHAQANGLGGHGSSFSSDSSPDLHNGLATPAHLKKVKAESETPTNPDWPWGMPPDEYQKLDSAKKKQVRNRVGAAKFRRKRNAKIDSLETGYRRLLSDRNRLMRHVRDLEKELADRCAQLGEAPPSPIEIEPEQDMPNVFPTPLKGQAGYSPTQGLGLEFTPAAMSLALSNDSTGDDEQV